MASRRGDSRCEQPRGADGAEDLICLGVGSNESAATPLMDATAAAPTHQAVERVVACSSGHHGPRESAPRFTGDALRLLRHRDEPWITREQLVAARSGDRDGDVASRRHRHEVAVHPIDARLIQRARDRRDAIANVLAAHDGRGVMCAEVACHPFGVPALVDVVGGTREPNGERSHRSA